MVENLIASLAIAFIMRDRDDKHAHVDMDATIVEEALAVERQTLGAIRASSN